MIDWKEKPWGLTATVSVTQTGHIDKIEVEPGGFCSIHRHNNKDNLFFILEGALQVQYFEEVPGRGRRDAYSSDDFPTFQLKHKAEKRCSMRSSAVLVPAGRWHRFVAETRVVGVEVYRARPGMSINLNDIERFVAIGGINRELLL